MGTRRGQIPESFLRQSVPIKVRVTVGKLKQNQELQRSTEDLGGGGQEGWGGARGPPKGQAPTTSQACSTSTQHTKETWSCLHPRQCILYPTSQGGLSREPQLFFLFHRFKAKAGAISSRSMVYAAPCPTCVPPQLLSQTLLPLAKVSRRGRDSSEGFERQQSAYLEFMSDEVNSRPLSMSPCSCLARV